ncbi:diaminopimelate epimerase [Aristophania vespae]|uniref:diaminopimelate epimerase n=1 Tax=Aristophania vespae TaxID=2697033 RepID=UPI00235128C2|nr:diaminopimelate epimerase [Aristophania vespae]UMM64172.1 Diaminopimelate epimerase [Aristophania vespae]
MTFISAQSASVKIAFTKMHGLGNDFIVLDNRSNMITLTEVMIRHICDRHLGIGCDQLVLLSNPTLEGASVRVQFFNPDGSEAGACGNASRCVAKFIGHNPVIETQNGLLPTFKEGELYRVVMGVPKLAWQDIPLSHEADTAHLPLYDGAACSMGNPHLTLFRPVKEAALLGPELEHHALFPQRANIGFAEILSPTHMRLRVWERGAGLTLACGSGACAAVVNAARRNLVKRKCTVTMEKGDLQIIWEENGPVHMIGPAETVFTGQILMDQAV